MGKGEIARYEQFLLFPLCFLKACFPGASKSVIVWEWVNPIVNRHVRHDDVEDSVFYIEEGGWHPCLKVRA